MRTILVCLLVLAVGGSAVAEKRALTIADLYTIKSVTDPQYSPDGKRIAFTATTYRSLHRSRFPAGPKCASWG